MAPAPGPSFTLPAAATGHDVDVEQDLSFKLAHGEVIKGTYDIAGFTKRFGSMRGRLVVTDARVLYKARAKNILNESSVDNEIQLPDVSGLSLRAQRGLQPASIAVLIMLVIGTALLELLMLVSIGFVAFGAFLIAGFVVFLVAALLGWQVFRSARMERVSFSVQTRASGGSPIMLKGREQSRWSPLQVLAVPLLPVMHWLGIDHASMTDSDASYQATREMFDEIGALILDLQSRGVLGEAAR